MSALFRGRMAALAGVVALFAAVFTGVGAGTAGAVDSSARIAAVGGWTCPGVAVPPGYVITMFNRSGCNGAGAWLQQPVRDGIWTCSGSPIVSGYVITNYDRNGCSGVGGWYHQLVRNGIWTCPYSPIPAGYRSTTYDARGCSGLGAWLTIRA